MSWIEKLKLLLGFEKPFEESVGYLPDGNLEEVTGKIGLSYTATVGANDPNDGVIIYGSSSPFPRYADKVDIWAPIPTLVNQDDKYRVYSGGYVLSIGNQKFGPCCTTFSATDGIKMAWGINEIKRPKPWRAPINPSIPHLYALSRTQVTGGVVKPNIPNMARDGSSQFASLLAAKQLGLVSCAKYPWADLSYYDPQMCTSFISPTRPRPWAKYGPPPESVKVEVPLSLDVCHVYTEREAMSALANDFTLLFETDWYFVSTDQAGNIIATGLADGVGHAMSIQGYIAEPSGTRFCVRNQMGSAIFNGANHPRFNLRGTGLTPYQSLRRSTSREKYVPMLAVGNFASIPDSLIRKKL